jgi:hypothetical protein
MGVFYATVCDEFFEYDGTNSAALVAYMEGNVTSPRSLDITITSESGGDLVLDGVFNDGIEPTAYPHWELSTGDAVKFGYEPGVVFAASDLAQRYIIK